MQFILVGESHGIVETAICHGARASLSGSWRNLIVTRREGVIINEQSAYWSHEPYNCVYYETCASATTSFLLALRDNPSHWAHLRRCTALARQWLSSFGYLPVSHYSLTVSDLLLSFICDLSIVGSLWDCDVEAHTVNYANLYLCRRDLTGI